MDREVKKKRPSTQSVCAAVAAKNDPHFPESTLEVEYPKRHRNKEMGNTDNIKEKFEIVEALGHPNCQNSYKIWIVILPCL